MPHFNFKNIDVKTVKILSERITPTLAKATNFPEEWFIFNHVENTTFIKGECITEDIVIVEIHFLESPQEIKDSVAKILTDNLSAFKKTVFIDFSILGENEYYINSKTWKTITTGAV